MDQLYRMSEILTPAVDALLGDLEGERRAARMRYAQSGEVGGRWGDVLRGWQGQAELIRARLVKEVLATRLDSSSGQELKDLAKSEYFAELPNDPRKAVGEAVLQRILVNADSSPIGTFAKGIIPAGTRIKRTLGAALRVQATDSEFLTTAAVECSTVDSHTRQLPDGTWQHQQELTVPVEAARTGPHANLTWYTWPALNPRTGTIASEIFDRTFFASDIITAGGTLGVVDGQIRALARAMAIGNGGATSAAVIAGALTNPGVRHVAYAEDHVNAMGRLYVADESWASSATYREAILRELNARPWIGWGCRVRLFGVINKAVTVRPTIVLRSREYNAAQDEITDNVRNALTAYFDDRPDWHTWTLNAIGGTVGAADDRILACTAVDVLDAGSGSFIAGVDENGTVTGDEPPIALNAQADPGEHCSLAADHGVTPVYKVPGE